MSVHFMRSVNRLIRSYKQSRLMGLLPESAVRYNRLRNDSSTYKIFIALLIFVIFIILYVYSRSERPIYRYSPSVKLIQVCSEKEFRLLQNYQSLIDTAIAAISPSFSWINCDALFINDTSDRRFVEAQRTAKQFSYAFDKHRLILDASSSNRCNLLKRIFGFNEVPLSNEENEFPLAYAALVYKWSDEVFYMLSALYHPQNAYCIAVDGNSDRSFKHAILSLEECFPNIGVMVVEGVEYCGFSVINSVMQCLQALTESAIPWRYFQYISNFDLPLKTNREMVRIFKRLNGSFNSEVLQFQAPRLKKKKSEDIPYGITLYKSSLSATFSRESAEFFVSNEKVKSIIRFLNGTWCPDESLWTTVAGNKELGMPNGFDASQWLRAINRNPNVSSETFPYYISRFQIWKGTKFGNICKGKYVHDSCVFGVDDLVFLNERPELMAHKLYLDFQPAAFFCLYKRVRERAIENIEKFDDAVYAQMPGPRVLRGEPIENIYIERAN